MGSGTAIVGVGAARKRWDRTRWKQALAGIFTSERCTRCAPFIFGREFNLKVIR